MSEHIEIKKAVEDLHKNFHDFKETHSQFVKQELKGYVDPLLKSQMDKINEAMDKARDAADAGMKAQAAFKARMEVGSEMSKGKKDKILARKAFATYLRRGPNGMSNDEKNILVSAQNKMLKKTQAATVTTSDISAGVFVLPEFDAAITHILYETSPLRQISTVKTISTDQYEKPYRIERSPARWVDRNQTFSTPTDSPNFGKSTIKVWGLNAKPKIHQNVIDDAVVDIVAEIQAAVAMEFELDENTVFVLGDGQGQPQGIITYPDGTDWGQVEQTDTATSGVISSDDILSLVYQLKNGYRNRARFVMNRDTQRIIRSMKDGEGRYIWAPGFERQPDSLLGYPILQAQDMPNATTGTLPIAFGDFLAAYCIVDRVGTRMIIDMITQDPYTQYSTTRRVGAGVLNFEAYKILAVS